MILQVPSICFVSDAPPEKFDCRAHFEHVTRDWQFYQIAQFDFVVTIFTAFSIPVKSSLSARLRFCSESFLCNSASGVWCHDAGQRRAPLLPSSISTDTSVGVALFSNSVADLFTRCCSLPLTADNADFMDHLSLGFGSGSIGVSLNSCDAGAASCEDETSRVPLLPLPFSFRFSLSHQPTAHLSPHFLDLHFVVLE